MKKFNEWLEVNNLTEQPLQGTATGPGTPSAGGIATPEAGASPGEDPEKLPRSQSALRKWFMHLMGSTNANQIEAAADFIRMIFTADPQTSSDIINRVRMALPREEKQQLGKRKARLRSTIKSTAGY